MGCTASTLNTLQLKAIESNEIKPPHSISTPFVHHPSLHKGDTNHLVCLISSSYGSINFGNDAKMKTCDVIDEKIESFDGLDDFVVDNGEKIESFHGLGSCVDGNGEKIGSFNGLDDCGVCKCDNDVISTWELMENDDVGKSFELGSLDFGNFDQTLENPRWDLVDCGENLKNFCDFRKENCLKLGFSLSDSVNKSSDDDSYVFVEFARGVVDEKELNLVSNSKPLLKHSCEKTNVPSERAPSLSVGCNSMVSKPCVDDGDKIVLYFTSLRGIRKTYEDCCLVRLILRGFRVMIEEKDISMDLNYRKELQSALDGKAMTLPQLFIGKRHIGGAEEIKEMHETGELERLLDGFPVCDRGFVCEQCGESRFIPCLNCNGSQKVFDEDEGQTMKCPECNENGLVRCPECCS